MRVFVYKAPQYGASVKQPLYGGFIHTYIYTYIHKYIHSYAQFSLSVDQHLVALERSAATIGNKQYLCIIDYHNKYAVIKQVDCFSTDNLIKHIRLFLEYGLPSKIVSDVSRNFVSEKFQDFCRCFNIHHAVSLSYNLKVMDRQRHA